MRNEHAHELVAAIVLALEGVLELDDAAGDRATALELRLAELVEDVAALSNRIGRVYELVRPYLVAKGAEQTMRCAECDASYAAEVGPPLCGPCWTRLGRPVAWPPVSPLRLA